MDVAAPVLPDADSEGHPLTLSANELASLLGISERTVWRMVTANDCPIPILRFGKRVRFSRLALEEYLRTGGPQR